VVTILLMAGLLMAVVMEVAAGEAAAAVSMGKCLGKRM
jgi:hypothetical protein